MEGRQTDSVLTLNSPAFITYYSIIIVIAIFLLEIIRILISPHLHHNLAEIPLNNYSPIL